MRYTQCVWLYFVHMFLSWLSDVKAQTVECQSLFDGDGLQDKSTEGQLPSPCLVHMHH